MSYATAPRGILATAVAGLLLVGAAGPAMSSASTVSSGTSLEAETMTFDHAHGAVIADTTASGGSYLGLWADIAASGTLSAPKGGHLVVRARSTSCHASANASVSIDGREVAVMSFGAGWSDRVVSPAWSGGTHTVSVMFTNDWVIPACDRNLLLDVLSVRPLASGDRLAPAHGALPGLATAFGLSSPGADGGLARSEKTAGTVDRQLNLVNLTASWSTKKPLPVTQLTRIAAAGARPEITWLPWSPAKGARQTTFTPKAIAQGRYDTYILSWAHAAARYGQPLLLRFAPDPNGTWYPWAPAANGQRAKDYVAAYRHVHKLFAAARADNVAWVWSPYAVQGLPTPVTSVYPGDTYVDVIGVDAYNGGKGVRGASGWRTPSQLLGPTLTALHRRWPSKPVMLNEIGSTTKGGSKPAWIRQLFGYLQHTSVTGVVWYNVATPRIDWRLNSSASSVVAARQSLAAW